ncbi:MAG: hypothetical protein KF810_17735 [Rhizobiaceae bacterium]|nr:hypothetical protein [Rhizobiaceae bacterium]
MSRKRFEDLLGAETAGLGPYGRPSDSALRNVARQLAPEDVADIVAKLEELTRERHALPAWDGDSSDDIAEYQERLTGLLARTSGSARAALMAWDGSADDLTRSYVEIARSRNRRPFLWWRVADSFR